MTGLAAYSHDDPADHEHFGISIVEGMSAGCLPIAYCVGGAGDIIRPGERHSGWKHFVGLSIAKGYRLQAAALPHVAPGHH